MRTHTLLGLGLALTVAACSAADSPGSVQDGDVDAAAPGAGELDAEAAEEGPRVAGGQPVGPLRVAHGAVEVRDVPGNPGGEQIGPEEVGRGPEDAVEPPEVVVRLFVAGGGGLIAVLAARRVGRPIQQLAESTHEIAAGNFGERVEAVGIGRELVELGQDFAGFGTLDLSGHSVTGGVSVAF